MNDSFPSRHAATPTAHIAAFTLVELSVVLVIIALLVGGVVSGTSLLRAASLKSVVSEYKAYESAIGTFKTKYDGYPGDLKDAATIWGWAPNAAAPTSTDATCAVVTTASQGTRTCNGDGDGIIETGYEEFRAWQHLANAGMVAGSFTGVGTTGAGTGFQADTNVPKSDHEDAGWRVFYMDNTTASQDVFSLFYSNYETHLLSLWGGTTAQTHYHPTLLADEAHEMDLKMDDGLPATGVMTVPHAGSGGTLPFDKCTLKADSSGEAVAADVDAIYNSGTSRKECQPFFRIHL